MNLKLSLPINNPIWIMNQPKSSANIFYLRGHRSSGSAILQHIDMCMVSESQPEQRLATLLAKGLLQQAEVHI